jgi:hypothetical protein
MANVVEIVIRVDNAQANAALGTTVQALRSAGVAGQVSFGQLSQASGVSVAAMQNAGAAAKTMGGHMTTGLDSVRLLSQEFGLRLPRALEAMLSRMPAVTSAITSLIGVVSTVAIAEVFVRAGTAVYNLYEKYFSLNAAAKEYQDTVDKQRDAIFMDPHSIEVTIQRINEATEAAKNFKAVSESLNDAGKRDIAGGFMNPFQTARGIKEMWDSRDEANKGNKSQEQADGLRLKAIDDNHQAAVWAIEEAHAKDASYLGQKRTNAELEKKLALNAEDRRYNQQRDSSLQGSGLVHGGEAEQRAKDAIARGEAAAQQINMQREIRDRTIQMQNEATNAGLRDGALQLAQKVEAEATIRRSATGTQAQIDAVEAKFFNEQKKRIEELTEATKKLSAESARAGLSGVPQIAGDLTAKLGEIEDARHRFIDGAGLTPDQTHAANNQFDSQRGAANAAAMQKRRALDEEYTDSVRAQVAQRVEAEQSGFDRIEAARAAEKQKVDRDYSKNYVRTAQDGTETDLGSEDNHAARAQLDAAIDRASNAERLKLTEEVRQQTLQSATEAAAAERRVRASGITGWVADYRSGVAEVQAAEQQMLSRIQQEQNKTGRNPETDAMFNQQRVAAVQKADTQIAALNQGMAKEIASTLQGAFDDPVHYIQRKMMQMFTEILANWIMQSKMFSSTFGSLIGGAHATQGTGINAGAIGAGSRIPGITSSTTNTGSSVGSEQDSSGTVDQAMVAPGYSGTASYVGGGGSFGGGGSYGGGGLVSSMAMAGPIAQMGLGIAHRNAAIDAGSASSAGINDGTIGSEQDASSIDSTGMTVAQAQGGSSGSGSGMQNAIGGVIGAGVGAYTGTKGIIGAFESGKASGILTGAESGAAMGASVGMLAGPAGAVIGGALGAVGGATAGLVGWASGEGNRLQTKKYFKDSMRPQMQNVETTYMHGGGGDALSAISQIDSIASRGYIYMAGKFGSSAAQWAKAAYIDKERNSLESQISRLASAGRDYTSKSAAQFHSGGTISDFGDFATSPTEGWVHALLGEKMVTPSAASAHGPTIDMMNAGASPSDIASQYLKNAGTLSQGGNTNHYHSYGGHTVNALDGSDFYDFLTKRGGADAMARANNKRAAQYAGDAA